MMVFLYYGDIILPNHTPDPGGWLQKQLRRRRLEFQVVRWPCACLLRGRHGAFLWISR